MAPSQPFFFLKPSSALLLPGQGPILIPRGTVIHHEVELAFVLGKTLKNLDPVKFTKKDAIDLIDSYALAIDLTLRNVQDEAKKKGLPWSIGKGFDTFLPISNVIPKSKIADPYDVRLKLEVNGEVKQDGSTNLMIFPIHQILSTMSSIMTLEKGDIILTGTPQGVGPIVPGDKVEVSLYDGETKVEDVSFDVEPKDGPYVYKQT